ncbi:hypothetical protein PIB30_080282 [Stylosanthes scabra]|uniref:Uncharacterized protein n=1 Tax=Stylosanthes scabra TaxID=79078 RepID=A0ABU6YRN7_9FABA|nr:hypothetical protein [Stylosanthes scabra]
MNAVFEKFMVLNRSHVPIKLPIEGYRLAHLEPNFNIKGKESGSAQFSPTSTFFLDCNQEVPLSTSLKVLEKPVYNMSLNRTPYGGDLNFAPFARRQIRPNWFHRRRVKEEGKTEAQLIVDKHWSNYIAVQVLPIGFPSYKKDRYKIIQPIKFVTLFPILSKNLLTRTFYDPIPCLSSNFVTRNFIKWWDAYYRQYNRSLDEMIAGINRKKEQLKESEMVAQEEQATQKMKAESESNQSEIHLKTTSALEKPPTPESARSASGNSLDVSSKSKESSNSKDKRASPEKERIEESTARESVPSLDIIVGEEKSPCGIRSEGYSISNLSKSAERLNPILDEIDQALNNPVGKMNSPLEEREIIQEISTPKVPI